jgi:HTH-type transcriptional regulator / antitoxin HipB
MRAITTATQIGAILAARRKQLGLSQAQVATRVGLSQNRLSVLEKNSSTLTAKQMLALLNVLGLDLSVDVRSSGGKPKAEW